MQDYQNENTKTENGKVLDALRGLINSGVITKDDILSLFPQEKKQIEEKGSGHTVKTIYFVGGIIVVLGLGIFIFSFWVHWHQLVKVLFSLGLAAALYALGFYFHNKDVKFSIFSNISFILSSFMMPLGIGTFLDLVGSPATTNAGLSINFAILFIWYFVSYWFFKYNTFLLFAALCVSSLFITFTNLLSGGRPNSTFYEYRILILGASLSAFGYYFEKNKKEVFNIFYFFGLTSLLSSVFALSTEAIFWQLVFPFIIAGTFYASNFLKNKLILFLATIFTFMEVGYLTSRYFSDSLGWPIALIIAGFAIIMVGYLSYGLGKKYAKN